MGKWGLPESQIYREMWITGLGGSPEEFNYWVILIIGKGHLLGKMQGDH